MKISKIIFLPVLLLLNTQIIFSQSWYQIPSPTGNNLNGLFILINSIYTFGNAGTCFVKDDNAITWTNRSAPAGINIKAMVSIPSGTFLVGNAGKVYINNGASWTQYLSSYDPSSNPTFNINSVWSEDYNNLYIVGDGGNFAIAAYVGTGMNYWQHPSTGTTQRLNSLWGGFATNGVNYILAVGDNGTILKSMYPYTSISARSSGTTANLYCIALGRSLSTGPFAIAVGANGTILKSTDVGETWTQSVSHTNNDLYCVSYIGGYGYACGANGTILRDSTDVNSPNRGVNWIPQISHTTESLKGIEQFLGDEIYAVGNNGNIFRSTTGGLPSTLSLTALIQGFYSSISNLMVPDTASVILRSTTAPYSIVDSSKVKLSNTGAGTFSFSNAANGTPYYVVVKHRNSIETWSSASNSFSAGALTYNFTTSQSRAYGNNMILKGTKYCLYNGDVNHDGSIDLSDLTSVYNSASNFTTGYAVTDLTGDNIVDLNDLTIAYNNSNNFVSVIKP